MAALVCCVYHFGLPDFDCIVSQSADNPRLIVLKTVHTLTGLTSTVNSLEGVAPGPPVCFDPL